MLAEFLEPLSGVARKLEKLTLELGGRAMQNRDEVGAAAADYLRVLGHVAFAYFWARMAELSLARPAPVDTFYTAKLATARFYFQRLLPEVDSLVQSATSGAGNLLALDADCF